MDKSELKKRKVVNKKNDLLTRLQKKIKKKVKKNVKRNEKRNEELNGTRQCRKSGVPEHRRLRMKGAPGQEGMFLKGLRTKYISRETLNEANEARKNEDINKIIDIGRVFQKRGRESGGRKRALNLNSAPENRKSQKISEKDFTATSEDFNGCSLSAISPAETTEQPELNTDATIILQENNDQPESEDPNTTTKNVEPSLDKSLVMFSMLYEEKVGSQLLPRLTEHDVLEEAFKALRDAAIKDAFPQGTILKSSRTKGDDDFCEFPEETLVDEFVKGFKIFTENLEPEIPLAEIFGEDSDYGNHAEKQSSDICVELTEKPMEDDLINLSEMRICKNEAAFVPSLGEEQLELKTTGVEIHEVDLNTTTPQIQFYRRNMF